VLLPEFLEFFEEWKEVVHGLILVSILLFLPQGLVVGLLDLAKARSARRRLRLEAGS
jgi:branched-chain amino acid transport system permease protein